MSNIKTKIIGFNLIVIILILLMNYAKNNDLIIGLFVVIPLIIICILCIILIKLKKINKSILAILFILNILFLYVFYFFNKGNFTSTSTIMEKWHNSLDNKYTYRLKLINYNKTNKVTRAELLLKKNNSISTYALYLNHSYLKIGAGNIDTWHFTNLHHTGYKKIYKLIPKDIYNFDLVPIYINFDENPISFREKLDVNKKCLIPFF